MIRKLLAECIGTFALVFAGTGAIVANDLHEAFPLRWPEIPTRTLSE